MKNSFWNNPLPRTLFLGVGLLVLWRLRLVVLILVVAFVLTIVLMPLVRQLRKIKMPAPLAVFLPILGLAGLLTGLFIYLKPLITDQFPRFIREMIGYVEDLVPSDMLNVDLSAFSSYVTDQFGDFATLLFSVGSSLVQTVFALVTVLVIVSYWLNDYERVSKTVISYLPKYKRSAAKDILSKIEHKLGKWFVGQVMVSVVVGLATYVAARILGLPYAGVLAIIAGLLEIVPTVGPIMAALPAIALGATESFQKALIVTAVYIIIQQLESHLLSPMLLGKTVKLHPIIIITSFISAALLFGLIGGLMAVPVALIASAFVDHYREKGIQP